MITYKALTNDPNNSMFTSFSRRKKFIIAISVLPVLVFLLYATRFSLSGASLPLSSSTGVDTSESRNIAVLIESRQNELDNLSPLVLHFSSILGPSWPIYLFIAESNTEPPGAPLARAIKSGHIVIKYIPTTVHINNRGSVSEFLTSPWLWEQLAPAGHVLLFQSDSIICANSPLRMDDFLEYDFVGAPIKPGMGRGDEGMNGGLSLRNRSMVLDIVTTSSWKEELIAAGDTKVPNILYEDQWFYKKMMRYPGARFPSIETAMTFSVETMWYEKPLGYHQVGIGHWQENHIEEIDRWCPEHRMTSNVKITD